MTALYEGLRIVDIDDGRNQPGATRGSPQALWRHRISEEDYEAMVEAQGGRCGICGREDKKLVIDHDHGCCDNAQRFGRTCGLCVRGLLCHGCNMFVGFIERSSPAVLARALRYIDGANARSVGESVGGAAETALALLA